MDTGARTEISTGCVVVGGGPAGLMLGLLLARAGVEIVVVEKHADFLRDFRGDTIHPSTQDILADLGLLDEFLALPHTDMPRVTLRWHGTELVLADFSRLPTRRRAIAFMPQWDFLDLLASAGEREPTFRLLRSTRVDEILRDGSGVVGVRGAGPNGPVEVRARLVIAADGRDSTVRAAAGMVPRRLASGMDVLWFRLPRTPGEEHPFLQAGAGMLIAIDRGDFYQVAHVVPAGSWDPTPAGLDAVRARVARTSPAFAERMHALRVDDVHLLRVRLERLRRWYDDGLLAIGDAAHAMSPAGGVGINLAVQDAVAAARILTPALLAGRPGRATLRRVQRRRALPAMLTQRVQRLLQGPLLAQDDAGAIPLPLRVLRRTPALTHWTGRVVGLGFRPERVGGAGPRVRREGAR